MPNAAADGIILAEGVRGRGRPLLREAGEGTRLARQQDLFDPFEGDPYAARARRAAPTPAAAQQLVLELIVRFGGAVDGARLMDAGIEAGVSTDELSAAVASLTAAHRVRTEGGRILLAA